MDELRAGSLSDSDSESDDDDEDEVDEVEDEEVSNVSSTFSIALLLSLSFACFNSLISRCNLSMVFRCLRSLRRRASLLFLFRSLFLIFSLPFVTRPSVHLNESSGLSPLRTMTSSSTSSFFAGREDSLPQLGPASVRVTENALESDTSCKWAISTSTFLKQAARSSSSDDSGSTFTISHFISSGLDGEGRILSCPC